MQRTPCCGFSLFVIALFAGLGVTRAQNWDQRLMSLRPSQTLENDGVKADLAGDPDFTRKLWLRIWTRGDSDGTYYTKAVLPYTRP